MEVLGDISTLISLGQDVEGIFGGATPPLSDIEGALTTEVAAVFFGEQADAEVISAAATLQTVRDFFAFDYVNTQKTGGDLWALLNSGSGPSLSDLSNVEQTVGGWLAAADDQPAPKDMISKACSVCLGVYLHKCLLYRARASAAPASADPAAELLDMQSYAQEALTNLQSRVMNRIANRIACLAYTEGVQMIHLVPYFFELSQAGITDSWFAGGSNDLLSSLPNLPAQARAAGWNPSTVVHRILNAYRRLLWSGADADYNELLAALNDPGMGVLAPYSNQADHSMRDAFIANSLPGVLAFGKWAASARQVLISLDVMVMGYPGTPQDDWHRCSQCGALYFETGFPDDGTKRCAKGGQHTSTSGSDYVLHSVTDPATVPTGMQSGWCYCPKCHVLFYKASGLNVCAAGGVHDPSSSANYFLGLNDVPTELGITIEQAWLFCGACSALHSYKNGVSVCPGMGGGAHQSGTAQYWLSSLGSSA